MNTNTISDEQGADASGLGTKPPHRLHGLIALLHSEYAYSIAVNALVSMTVSTLVFVTLAHWQAFAGTGRAAQPMVSVDLRRLVDPPKDELKTLSRMQVDPARINTIVSAETKLAANVEDMLDRYASDNHVIVIQKDAIFAAPSLIRDITSDINAQLAPQRAAIAEMVATAATEATKTEATPVTPAAPPTGGVPPFPGFPPSSR